MADKTANKSVIEQDVLHVALDHIGALISIIVRHGCVGMKFSDTLDVDAAREFHKRENK